MARLLLFPLLALLPACTLTLELVYPGHRISGLETQRTYCTYGDTRVDFRFLLEGSLDRLELYWLAEGQRPQDARPGERYALWGPIRGGSLRGWLQVTPSGEIRAVSLTTPQSQGEVLPQGIVVEPLPERRLWLRGFTGGVAGPFVPARNPVRPDASSACDPLW
ncbi:hypothetical protein [Thermus thermamylovorans]|uniref:Uncharacterized protein n=1 Tax=Thermus thermamylovorans TaxID=2509362 RepID=A0A4Q9B666_9DEIN|nr:hypothetical protein [Thermus thermamylovorans]TBH21442.1 hypothetical protein ETP66_02190 [Thermus thermamylovorans]